jgi:hypothetical protein
MGGVKGQQQYDQGRNVGLGCCRRTLRSIAAPTSDVPDCASPPEKRARFVIDAAPIGDVANRPVTPSLVHIVFALIVIGHPVLFF